MEQMIDVTGQWTYKIALPVRIHANGTLRSSCTLQDSHLVNLLATALTATVFAPVICVTLSKTILHVRIDLPTILSKYELF